MSILSELGKDLPYENRKTRWSRLRREQGLCFCEAKADGKSLCPDHMRRQNDRMRDRRNVSESNKSIRAYSDIYDAAGNLRPDLPKKPQVSSPTQEAAERFTSERLAALIQFQPKKETA